MTNKLTIWLRLLCYGLIVLAASGLLRAVAALRLADWIVQFGTVVSPLYLAITGGVTCLGGLAAAYGVWRRLPWGAHLARAFVLLYTAWYWVDRLAIQQSQASRANGLFAALFSAYCVVYTFLAVRD